MKNLKKLLRQQSGDILPDERVKDNIKLELGMGEKVPAAQTASGGTIAVRRRNIIIAACAAALAIIIALCIILPSLGGGQSGVNPGLLDGGSDNGKFDEITDADSFYAYGAASIGAVLSTQGGSTQTAATGAAKASAVTLAAPSQEEMDTINRYMALVESLLSEGDITGTAIEGNGQYQYGMTVSYSDLLGNPVSYVMYYDKIFRGSHTDGDESESNYSIDGVLVIDGASYPVSGNYTTESEQDEEETSIFFRAYTSSDRLSYIEVSRQSENESEDGQSESEVEYVYTVYSDGRVVERTRVEYESEEGELELLMTIERDGVRESLTFEDETEGGTRIIAVRGNIDGESVSFKIYVREGNYHYVFDDGTSSDFDRYDGDDDDDDDRDDDDDDDRRRRSVAFV